MHGHVVGLVQAQLGGDQRSRVVQVRVGHVLEELGEVEEEGGEEDAQDGSLGPLDGAHDARVHHEAQRQEPFNSDSDGEPGGAGQEDVGHHVPAAIQIEQGGHSVVLLGFVMSCVVLVLVCGFPFSFVKLVSPLSLSLSLSLSPPPLPPPPPPLSLSLSLSLRW